MLDFNTKKDILRKLRKKRTDNKLMWLPCVAAAAFVKVWYAIVCRMGMALSDKEGNLLGVKGLGEKKKSRRQDDIVYVKRPFLGRVLSAVLAVSFVMMLMPEFGIDFGIIASAAETAIIVKDDDTQKSYRLIPKIEGVTVGEIEAYLEDERLHARDCVTADITEIKASNGALRLSWAYRIEAGCNHVDQDGKHFTDYPITNIIDKYIVRIETASGYSKDFEYRNNQTSAEITGLPTNSSEYTVTIIPIAKMQLWRFRQGDPDATDEQLKKTVVGMVPGKKDAIVESDIRHDFFIQSGIYLDAKISAPSKFMIMDKDDNGNYTEIYKTNKNGVYIVWNPESQKGGMDNDNGEPATGYVIWRKIDNGSWVSRATVLTTSLENNKTSDGNYQFYDNEGIEPGQLYQYYVESYRVIWGDGTAYKENDPGIITSGNNSNGNEKSVYTAPTTPKITATQNVSASGKPYYEITVTRDSGNSSSNRFDGIRLFRTEDKLLTDADIPADSGYDTFAEWAIATINRGNTAQYGNLTELESAFVNSNVYRDTKSIVEGKTYYYYAVAYKNVRGSSILNGVLYASEYSTTNTTFSLTAFKETIPVITGISSTDGQITIQWDPIKGAEAYELEARLTGKHNDKNETEKIEYTDKDWVNIYTGPNTSYPHQNLYYSDRYEYRVRGIVDMETKQEVTKRDEDGNEVKKTEILDKIVTKWSAAREAIVGTPIGTPTITGLSTVDGSVTIKWEPVSNISGYYLKYTSNDPDDPEGIITIKATDTSHPHQHLRKDMEYTYWIAAYRSISIAGNPLNPQIVVSDYSARPWSIKVGTDIATPAGLTLSTQSGAITAKWAAVTGAEGYILYYKKGQDSSNINDFQSDNIKAPTTTVTHTGLKVDDLYTYKVQAYKTISGKIEYSPISTPQSISVGERLGTPQDLKATSKDGEIAISWSNVQGADGYTLWYRKQGSNDFTPVKVTKSPFNHTGLTNGDVYEYYVVAYKRISGVDEPGEPSVTITKMVGNNLDAPKDFKAVTTDGKVNLTWTRVTGAEGYIVYAYSGGQSLQFDISKTSYEHSGLANGDVWTYYVIAYKTVNGVRSYSPATKSISVTIGISLNSAVDLVATAGNRQIDLAWSKVNGAEGYVVYLYNNLTMEFEAITVTSKNSFSHVGLKNGQSYTYMVAPYKTINGERFYGEYSMAVTAIPTTGSLTDIDRTLNVKGTAPYGISHSEYISARSNHGAFDESVDVYFTTNQESTQAVRDVLKNYANGLSSFIIYPFDISIYKENTLIKVDPADGYTVTITMPIPDRLIAYRDYITIVHINEEAPAEEITTTDWTELSDQRLEVLPCAIVDIDNVWCVQFQCSSFSPYAIVIYKEHIQDVSSGGGVADGSFAGNFDSGVLLFTALPDIMPNNRKLRVVHSESKKYKIKSIEKR